ncbi:MAG: AAA family ATPase [Thermodesulfobacteriota bacterium]
MYYTHFGLKENPFKPTPDPRYLYLSRGHQEALDHLLYGIGERKGFVMITGSVGTGKTTLLRSLLEDLDENVQTALLLNPFLSDEDLLPAVCEEFGITLPDPPSKKACLDALNRFLLENYAAGRNAVLLLDEAQNLSRDVLEQVRILSNLETENDKLLQIVLVGQEELARLMTQNDLRQVNDRIVVRYNLGPLDQEDVRTYVQHRMTVAGSKGKVPFAPAALSALYGLSGGVPRRINAICDRALLRAYTQNAGKVTRDILFFAAKETGVDPGSLPSPAKRGGVLRYAAAGAAGAVLAAGALYTFVSLREGPGTAALAPKPAAMAAAPVQAAPAEPARIASPVAPARGEQAPAVEDAAKAPAGFRLGFEKAAVMLLSLSGGQQASGALFTTDIPIAKAARFSVPMQARLAGQDGAKAFIVIPSLDGQAARVMDEAGKEQSISVPELSREWEGMVSWWLPQRFAVMRLFPGAKGADVLWMQMALARAGISVRPDGVYGPETIGAVRSLQSEFGIAEDGVAGFQTIGVLYGLFPEKT